MTRARANTTITVVAWSIIAAGGVLAWIQTIGCEGASDDTTILLTSLAALLTSLAAHNAAPTK